LIVTEHIIRAIVDTIPNIRINDSLSQKAKFHWGDEEELNRFIQLKKEDSYPLIWLLPGDDEYEGALGQEVVKECTFIIATREDDESLFNDQRYIKTYDLVLNPLTDYLIHGLTASSITERIGNEWTIRKFPKYSAGGAENATIDLWDATRLTINIRFNGKLNCLNTINYDG
jgi:hypothetical protein